MLALGLVIFAAYGGVDLWGKGRWAAAAALVRQEGETLDVTALLPKPIPDDENCCAVPLLAGLALPNGQSEEAKQAEAKRQQLKALFKLPTDGKAGRWPGFTGGVTRGAPADLEAFARWMRETGHFAMPNSPGNSAADILKGLSAQEPSLAEMTAALGRPGAQWTPLLKADVGGIPLLSRMAVGEISTALSLGMALTLRATASAQAGDAKQAVDSLRIALRLHEATSSEPFVIHLLVAIAMQNMSDAAVWELSRSQVGTIEEWRVLELALAKIDYRTLGLSAFRGEMAAAPEMVGYAVRSHDPQMIYPMIFDYAYPLPLTPFESAMLGAASRIIPDGLVQANMAAIVSAESEAFVRPLRDEGWSALLTKSRALRWRMEEIRRHRFRHLDCLAVSVSSLAGVAPALIYAQTVDNQAVIACVLERYRIEHGGYPPSLDGLTLADGRPLPRDVMTGQAIHYRPTEDGRYALWSAGLTGIDHGGVRGTKLGQAATLQPNNENYAGDWVWDFRSEPVKR